MNFFFSLGYGRFNPVKAGEFATDDINSIKNRMNTLKTTLILMLREMEAERAAQEVALTAGQNAMANVVNT